MERKSPSLVSFEIEPLNLHEAYYGFELAEDPLHLMPDGTVFHNSGKSVMEQSIIGHVSRFADRFQLVGVDCKRVEFNLLPGVKGVKGVALDVQCAAEVAASFQKIMMDRFKFMEEVKVNNIFKIKDKEVDYYEWAGKKFQFDEIFELKLDLDPNDRNYSKMKDSYPDGRQPKIMTIRDIYNCVMKGDFDGRHPQMPIYKGYNSYIDKNSIRKTTGIFVPKALIFLADELNELMNSEDYKSVETVKAALGSIARLGRAAAVHLALACQRASGGTINSDLKNNIQMCCLLGQFDDAASSLMFDKDISNLSKPWIKGRGFIQSGNEIIETQTYYTQPEKDWVFDEDAYETYQNPNFKEQCKIQGRDFDKLNTGWVKQIPLDEILDSDEDEDIDTKVDSEFDDEEDENFLPIKKNKPAPPIEEDEEDEADDKWEWPEDEEDEDEEDEELEEESAIPEDVGKEFNVVPSTRDKVEAALGKTDLEKPKIKLNFDKTKGDSPKPTKTIRTIKINLPPPKS